MWQKKSVRGPSCVICSIYDNRINIHECDIYIHMHIHGWMDGWMDGWLVGWLDGWIDR